MEKIKILQETKNLERKYFQRIVEYNGHKFKYSITPKIGSTHPIPLNTNHALDIMLPDGSYEQIEDIVSIDGTYTSDDMAWEKGEKLLQMVETDFNDFDNFIKKVY